MNAEITVKAAWWIRWLIKAAVRADVWFSVPINYTKLVAFCVKYGMKLKVK